ncbi:MAG: VWA domain-containing protein [Planctomycetaceae bacterium]
MSDYVRRLPVYIVLDCSESMAGPAIADAQRGVLDMIDALRGDPMAIETIYVSLITFSSYAKQVVPLTEVLAFQMPRLTIRSGTALGSALQLVKQCIAKEVRQRGGEFKADYKPIVILLTDGEPTDNWEPAAQDIRRGSSVGIANIYGIAVGEDADPWVLRQVTDIVLQMKEMNSETWRKLFIWLTQSMQSTSTHLQSGGEGQELNLPALPDELEVAAPSTRHQGPPRQVFLHAWCQKRNLPYLMRFRRDEYGGTYQAFASHPLQPEELEGSMGEASSINTSQLMGVPECPHCHAPGAGACGCGAILCVAPNQMRFECPRCHQQCEMGGGGEGFDVRQSQG